MLPKRSFSECLWLCRINLLTCQLSNPPSTLAALAEATRECLAYKSRYYHWGTKSFVRSAHEACLVDADVARIAF